MPSYRMDRISGDIKKELAEVISELKDPRVSGLISVVRVEVTNDLSYVTAYISSMDGFDAPKNAVKGLENAAGFIRREMNHRVKLRKSPAYRFVADDGIEYSANFSKKLKDVMGDE